MRVNKKKNYALQVELRGGANPKNLPILKSSTVQNFRNLILSLILFNKNKILKDSSKDEKIYFSEKLDIYFEYLIKIFEFSLYTLNKSESYFILKKT